MCVSEQTTQRGSPTVRHRLYASRLRCGRAMSEHSGKADTMLYTIALVLLILWVLGLVSSYTLGGFIHILLVAAVVVVLVNFIGGRRS